MERRLRGPCRVPRGERAAPWTDRRPRGVPRPAGQLRGPAALGRSGLERHGPGRARSLRRSPAPPRPRPRSSAQVHFVLGQGRDRDARGGLVDWQDPRRATSSAACDDLRRRWDALTRRGAGRTPEPALDLMLNRWLLYQALASRSSGREPGSTRPGGAFGFRDQLQDVPRCSIARSRSPRRTSSTAPPPVRGGRCAPLVAPAGRPGVRTRCSDDLLWLPFIPPLRRGDRRRDDPRRGDLVPARAATHARRARSATHASSRAQHRSLYRHCGRALSAA